MELFHHLWNPQSFSLDSRQEGAPEKLTLLHGMGGTGALWRPVAATLENHFPVLAVDQRGHGKSQIPHTSAGRGSPEQASYTPLDYGRDICETLEAQKFFPTWLLGHSMGVRSAVAAAHLKPELFRGLILVDLGFSGVAGGGLGESLAQFLRKLPLQFETRAAAREFLTAHCPDPSMAQYLMAVSMRDPQDRIYFPFDHGALIQTIQAARDVSVRHWIHDLAKLGKPILVLRGAQSLVWKHEDYENEKQQLKAFPHVEFQEVPNAGHGLPFEQRAVFVDIVLRFIESSLGNLLRRS